ncbi:hypothetical protein [Parabacteroides sp. PF5-9]|uniref:hypothetical protein n=1 Tax=Parabacteroides sp. PF5-9 TaxID=1742404 RepID=UPI0024759E69|nr:hypothetical protein [Parabacteroides sp. PF5-9]MDH6356574.1 hypothetical protein [Parabacteroides sp. PF5-9]
MMKRTGISLLWGIVFTLNIFLFVACSDDDKDPTNSWNELSGTYQEKMLNPKLNNRILIVEGKSVDVQVTSADKATLTLFHFIPDFTTVAFDVDLKLTDGQYTISGEFIENGVTLIVNGFFDKYGILNIDLTRKMNLPVTGNWRLNFHTGDSGSSADVYVAVQTANPALDDVINMVAGPAVGQLIAGKVSMVNISLGEDGFFNVSWRKQGENEDTYLPEYIMQMLNIQYTMVDDQLMLAVDRNLITLAEFVVPLLDLGIRVEDVITSLSYLGGYYAIPFNLKEDGGHMTFYLSKEVVIPVIDLLIPFLVSSLPENLTPLVESLLGLLPTAEKLDVGLVFQKN